MRLISGHVWLTITNCYDPRSTSYNSCIEVKPLHSDRPNANVTTATAWKAVTTINELLCMGSSHGIQRGRVVVLLNVCYVWPVTGRPTSYMAVAMAIAMAVGIAMVTARVIIRGKQKSLLMLPSQDMDHTIIGDVTNITVSNSDNKLHLVWVISASMIVE